MANDGKYVRLAGISACVDDNSIAEEVVDQPSNEVTLPVTSNASSSGSTSGSHSDSECDGSDIDVGDVEDIPDPNNITSSSYDNPSNSTSNVRLIPEADSIKHLSHDAVQHASNTERIERMEQMISGINEALSRFQPNPRPTTNDNADNSWNNVSSCANVSGSNSSSIRWDHIKPFPTGIAANKMWEEWNRYIENFEIAASLSNVSDPAKRTQLLFLSMGNELQEIIKAAKLRPSLTNPECYKTFVTNIKNYFRSMTDTAAEHEAFSRMKQENGEAAVTFHARLMCKVRSCNYSVDDEDRFVRAQLLSGLRNRELVKQARTYGYETNFIVQSATRDEAFEAETRQQEGPNIFEVRRGNLYSSYDRSNRKRPNASNRIDEPPIKRQQSHELNQRYRVQRPRCTRCYLLSHRNGQCPALSRNCNRCGKRGHFVAACRQKQVNSMQNERNDKPIERSTFSGEDTYENKQEANALSLEDVLVNCSVGSSSPIRFLIDSGADVNVIGGRDWEHLERESELGIATLEMISGKSSSRLHAYGTREPMTIDCTFKASIIASSSLSESTNFAVFHVVTRGARSLLGRSTASDMGLLHIKKDINHCEDDGIFPIMPGVKVKFSVNKDVPPTKSAYYNVPAAYREAARQRLQEMERRGIIEKATSAPNWISGMSAVAKGNNDFRLVVNMRAPNRAINREYYRLPLLDEMRVKLHGARYFSKLDLSNAFYHLELSEESRVLTTFLAEDGMYRFTRLMFGVNCAPEIFQREMVRILKDVDNIIVFIDDILIFAETLEALRATVTTVLQILKENNLTLNTTKCEFDQTRIKFLGHELDAEGFHIDHEKIKSVRTFREPTTLSELRSFLGLASFLSPYLENFAKISNPLWATTTSKTWLWGPEQKEAFIHFTLRTDAQGVTFILNRSREESKRALTRADGWALRLSPYNYNVEYIRGIDNIADSSSRLYLGEDAPFDEEASPWEIAVLEANAVEFLTETDIKCATEEDETLLQVISALESGVWPKDLQKYHAQNGLAESCMKLVNKAMATATANNTNYIEELQSAVNAHNAAEHSVTNIPPEEVMYGRKIKRGLPLLTHDKSSFDEHELERRDREIKLAGKLREDARRGAQKCRVKPGDEVVIERQNRLKGDHRFSPTRYTVIEERNGSLVLNDGSGKIAKRHVSQTKKIGPWRNIQKQKSSVSTDISNTDTTPTAFTKRPNRDRKIPVFLNDFIRTVKDE
ncbi:uncharacterized protein LOC131680626 [Topomyia yanbarensis]|uniref:uncharacterized protein LOC131680626 n=1 Tax=Topomyia yanbarensis TaxID=2498891 RepID=UPI00273B0E6C|nr:uncharacterized protein LOC131680626 [Topomyia yanbarensis]